MVEVHPSIPTVRRTRKTAGAPPGVQAAIEVLATPAAVLAASGLVVAVNEAWRAAARDEDVGCCPEGENYVDWSRTLDDGAADPAFLRGVTDVLAGSRRSAERLRRGGGARELRVRIRRVAGHAPARFLVSHEYRKADAADDVEDRVLKAQIEERERIAAELHDSVGQNLVCLGLGLGRLRRLAPPGSEIAGVVGDMSALLQQAHAEIRTLSFLLQPPWLEERGSFGAAVRDLVAGFARRAGLHATAEIEELPPLCRGRQLTLYRILQEALVNVHRHARADAVGVRFSRSGRQLVMTVRDNGRGMVAAEGKAPDLGVGILGMRGRLRKWGGDLRIVSSPAGTTVTAKLLV
jgi:signal transduction histidine kinase